MKKSDGFFWYSPSLRQQGGGTACGGWYKKWKIIWAWCRFCRLYKICKSELKMSTPQPPLYAVSGAQTQARKKSDAVRGFFNNSNKL